MRIAYVINKDLSIDFGQISKEFQMTVRVNWNLDSDGNLVFDSIGIVNGTSAKNLCEAARVVKILSGTLENNSTQDFADPDKFVKFLARITNDRYPPTESVWDGSRFISVRRVKSREETGENVKYRVPQPSPFKYLVSAETEDGARNKLRSKLATHIADNPTDIDDFTAWIKNEQPVESVKAIHDPIYSFDDWLDKDPSEKPTETITKPSIAEKPTLKATKRKLKS